MFIFARVVEAHLYPWDYGLPSLVVQEKSWEGKQDAVFSSSMEEGMDANIER